MLIKKGCVIPVVIFLVGFMAVIGLICHEISIQGTNRLIGKIDIPGMENRYFKIYREIEFDHVTGAFCEVVDQKDNVILPMTWFTGISGSVDIEDFTAGSYDGIAYLIFLSYLNSNEISVIYDSSTNTMYVAAMRNEEDREKRKQLLTKLQEYNKDLKLIY